MIDVNNKILAALQASSCFAIAYDETVPECKKCDVSAQCKVKSSGFPLDNETTRLMDKATAPVRKENATKKKATTATSKKKASAPTVKKSTEPQVKINGEMPDFKGMKLEELQDIARKHSIEWRDYGNDNITRMRLIMQLKKCYQ